MLYAIEDCIKQHARDRGYTLHIRQLHIQAGDTLAITGPSGCGKSTMLDMLGLALRPDSAARFSFTPEAAAPARDEAGPTDSTDRARPAAAASWDIMPLWQKGNLTRMAGLRLQYMGYVLQTGGLLPFITVEENMLLTARMKGLSRTEARAAAEPLAQKLGIGHLLKAMPAQLSVGERQRVAIVRALTPRPRLILADEPTAALDPLHAARVMDVFLQAVQEQQGTLLMVTHDAAFARRGGLREVSFDVQEDDKGVCSVLDDGLSPSCPPEVQTAQTAQTGQAGQAGRDSGSAEQAERSQNPQAAPAPQAAGTAEARREDVCTASS